MFIISLIIFLLILVFFSLEGEKKYIEECEGLGIDCDKGTVQEATESLQGWGKKTYQKIKDSNSIQELFPGLQKDPNQDNN